MLNFALTVQMAGNSRSSDRGWSDPLRTNSWPNFFRASSKTVSTTSRA